MALAPEKKRLLVNLGAVGLLLVLTQLVGYRMSVGSQLKEKKKVRVLLPSQAAGIGNLSPPGQQAGGVSVLLDLRLQPSANTTNLQLIFSLEAPASPVGRAFLQLCSLNMLAGRAMRLSSGQAGPVRMPLRDMIPGGPGAWWLSVQGAQVDSGSDEGGWRAMGSVQSGGDEVMRHLLNSGDEGRLEVQDCRTL